MLGVKAEGKEAGQVKWEWVVKTNDVLGLGTYIG